jgi:hypothetical protein
MARAAAEGGVSETQTQPQTMVPLQMLSSYKIDQLARHMLAHWPGLPLRDKAYLAGLVTSRKRITLPVAQAVLAIACNARGQA